MSEANIPKPADEEQNPAIVLLDGDLWLSYCVGDYDQCAVLRFKNLHEVHLTKGEKETLPQVSPATWSMTFGQTTVHISAEDIEVCGTDIEEDPNFAVWQVAHEIRNQEGASHSLREFYDSLAGKVAGEKCAANGCAKDRIPHSVFCRKHHFEAIMKTPCPYE